MTQTKDDVVVTLVQLEPGIIACSECDGVRFHVYSDKSMVCANKNCGTKTLFGTFEGDDND